MAHPLELSYNWRTPVGMATVGLIVCIGVLFNSRVNGWAAVAVVLVVMWAAFLAVVWLRTRAYMRFDGPTLRVRRFRGFAEIDGRTVSEVKEFLTPSGPSYKVTAAGTDGETRRYIVPTALLRRGHSTFFDWLQTWSPRAELDKGCRRTIDQLRTRGLIE